MKRHIDKVIVTLVLLALSTLNSQFSALFAQGSAFTYQGELTTSNGPANGTYNFTFTLFNMSTGGVGNAGPVTNNAVNVTNGLFTTIVDFGPGVFTGMSNWLEIAVETNGGSSFTNLSPRQQLTPVPYAIFAEIASNLMGMLTITQLPPNIVTNMETGVTLGGTFSGDGMALRTPNNVGWLYYYDQNNQLSGAANTFNNVLFGFPSQSDTSSLGWTYAATGTFTCNAPGTYLVEYNAEVQLAVGGSNASLRAELNGAGAVPGSGVNVDTIALAVGNYVPVSKSFMWTFNAGDTLSIQFASTLPGGANLLHGGGGVPGSSQASVSVAISRLY
jgi:hypothetical protein